MDFLNKVGESLTSFGNGMSARTKNIMDQSNLNSQLRQHENTLKGLYETIGRQYYAEKQGKGEGEYAEIFEQVAGVEALTDELRKKIEIAKSMVPCPKCGGLTESTSRFCKNCGNPMQPSGNTDAPSADDTATQSNSGDTQS